MCGICLIPLFFILCIGLVVFVLLDDGTVTVATTMTACEEVLVCPDSLKDGEITFSNAYSRSTAYLVKSTPPISDKTDVTVETPSDDNLDYGAYVYKTFNLVAGSTLFWHVELKNRFSSYSFDLYLIQGQDQLDKFIDNRGFNYLRYEYVSSKSEFNFTARETDEYAIVMEAYYGDSYITNQKYIVNHKHYDTTGLELDNCTSCTFSVNDDDFPGQCVVVKMPCSATHEEEDIKVYYNEAHNGLYYAALVIAILGGIGFAAAILVCVVCALRKSKGSSGQTYQNLATATPVNTTPVATTPVAPASYNTTPYQTPTPSYQQSAYTATAPAYTSVDPSAPPSYVPYGTAPTAY